MALQPTALSDLRKYIARRLYSAKYTFGGSERDATVNSITITDDDVVRVALLIAPGAEGTVTRVALYNTDNEMWASQDISITLAADTQRVLYWFDFTVEEG